MSPRPGRLAFLRRRINLSLAGDTERDIGLPTIGLPTSLAAALHVVVPMAKVIGRCDAANGMAVYRDSDTFFKIIYAIEPVMSVLPVQVRFQKIVLNRLLFLCEVCFF